MHHCPHASRGLGDCLAACPLRHCITVPHTETKHVLCRCPGMRALQSPLLLDGETSSGMDDKRAVDVHYITVHYMSPVGTDIQKCMNSSTQIIFPHLPFFALMFVLLSLSCCTCLPKQNQPTTSSPRRTRQGWHNSNEEVETVGRESTRDCLVPSSNEAAQRSPGRHMLDIVHVIYIGTYMFMLAQRKILHPGLEPSLLLLVALGVIALVIHYLYLPCPSTSCLSWFQLTTNFPPPSLLSGLSPTFSPTTYPSLLTLRHRGEKKKKGTKRKRKYIRQISRHL